MIAADKREKHDMKKILVVDDESSVRYMIKEMIEPLGFEVVEAKNGIEAISICNDSSVDLIITDIVMPDKNGIDLIMAVRKQYPGLPVIAMSGGGGIAGNFDYLEIAKLVGAKNILKKPFSSREICSLVEESLDERSKH